MSRKRYVFEVSIKVSINIVNWNEMKMKVTIEKPWIAESDMPIKNEKEFRQYRDALEVIIAKGTALGDMELLEEEDKQELCLLAEAIEKYESVHYPLPGKRAKKVIPDRFVGIWSELASTEQLKGEELDKTLLAIHDKYPTMEDWYIMMEYFKYRFDEIEKEWNVLQSEVNGISAKKVELED